MSNSLASEPTLEQAPILHVDLDAFFASVEVLDDPSLQGRPVCVGGVGPRGVIASASYEARQFGVRSAMPTAVAMRRCPELVVMPGRFDRYEEYSAMFHAIVRDLSPVYEPISLDEVFIDVQSLAALHIRPMAAGRALRDRLRDELRLQCGIGVARNKLFAKLGSKAAKPRSVGGRLVPGAGVFWVSPEVEHQWLHELPVEALWGVGPATAAKLRQRGLRLVRDLRKIDEATLAHHIGSAMAATLHAYAHGEDKRVVEVQRVTKSIGHDQTFAQSIIGHQALGVAIVHHAGIVARALRGRGVVAKTVTVGVRFEDFQLVQRSQSLPFGVDDSSAIAAVAMALLEGIDVSSPVRLLQVHAAGLMDRHVNEVQLSFGVPDGSSGRAGALEASRAAQVANEALRDVLDDIRQRYGSSAVGRASELSESGLDVQRQRGSNPFGPAATDVP